MSIKLKKINQISDLRLNETYLLFNKDIESSIRKSNSNTCTYVKVIEINKTSFAIQMDDMAKVIIQHDMLNKYLHFYTLDNQISNDVVNLKRKIKKLEKKNIKLNKILQKNNIQLTHEKESKNTIIKRKKKLKIVDAYKDNVLGYEDVLIVIKTNNTNIVEITISLEPCKNKQSNITVNEQIKIKGIATKHKDDEFNYELGKQLAYSRAINKLMERIVQL